MGRLYEIARLDGCSGYDAGNGRIAQRAGRGYRVTAWDWIRWWRERGSIDNVRCVAWFIPSRVRRREQALAVYIAQGVGCARFRFALRAGLQNQRCVSTGELLEIA